MKVIVNWPFERVIHEIIRPFQLDAREAKVPQKGFETLQPSRLEHLIALKPVSLFRMIMLPVSQVGTVQGTIVNGS